MLENMILGEWINDTEYDEYLEAWCQYHRLCEVFDRTISPNGFPRDYRDTAIMSRNARDVKKRTIDLVDVQDRKKWNRAKMEAVMIIKREWNDERG